MALLVSGVDLVFNLVWLVVSIMRAQSAFDDPDWCDLDKLKSFGSALLLGWWLCFSLLFLFARRTLIFLDLLEMGVFIAIRLGDVVDRIVVALYSETGACLQRLVVELHALSYVRDTVDCAIGKGIGWRR